MFQVINTSPTNDRLHHFDNPRVVVLTLTGPVRM